MKFRASVCNADLFLRILQTLQRSAKDVCVHLTRDKVLFMISTDVTDGVQVWAGLNASSLFGTYRIQSRSNDEISFTVDLENLVRAMKSGTSTAEYLVKLTKKNGAPFLNVSVGAASGVNILVNQDVPIDLVSAAQLAEYREPELPEPAVQILTPSLRAMRNVVDRMKNVSELYIGRSYLTISANCAGSMTLSVNSDMVSISTYYTDLLHPTVDGQTPPVPDASKRSSAKVDIRKFAKILYSYQVQPANVVCCLVPGMSVVLHVLLDDLYITYYMPVLDVPTAA